MEFHRPSSECLYVKKTDTQLVGSFIHTNLTLTFTHMMRKKIIAGILSLASISGISLAALPANAGHTALVGDVFVNSDPRLIRPSGFFGLGGLGCGGLGFGGLGLGCGGLGFGGLGLGTSIGIGGLGLGAPIGLGGFGLGGCSTPILGAAGFAGPCGLSSACAVPVLPFSDCPILWR